MLNSLIESASTIFSSIVGALFVVIVFRGEKRASTAREQLDMVYAPAFEIVAPFLYQKISRTECNRKVEELRCLTKNGGYLADPRLTQRLDLYAQSPDGDLKDYRNFEYKIIDTHDCYLSRWYEICYHIDTIYDELCKKAFIPRRSRRYRVSYHQYPNNFLWLFNFFRSELPSILFFFFVMLPVFALLDK